MLIRLDKLIADSVNATRSGARELIRAGRVRVNNVVCKKPDEKIDADFGEIRLDDQPVLYRRNLYLMMNKPEGYVSSTEDPREKTVLELLPEELQKRGLFPAGRLDKDAEGFLLLTNDGAFAHSVISPKRHVDKVYFITVSAPLSEADQKAFADGVVLSDGTLCRPAGLEIIPGTNGLAGRVTLREGKYHQVKRMTASRGKTVLSLKRISIGGVLLDDALLPGEWRFLTQTEEKKLKTTEIL
ncbi:MAG: pseudouridine synthase [Bacillota bacterium]|nr:pseudouridine synthase [Bacillota bacterium]